MNVRNFKSFLIAFIFSFWFQNAVAQEDYAILRKNFNISAKDLEHDLCHTKDTLILKSETRIDYVYSINRASKRELDRYVLENSFRIPLNSFSKGRHVFVVEQNKLNIVFVVEIKDTDPEIGLLAEERKIISEN